MLLKGLLKHKNKLLHDGSPYHTETSPVICFANQWTGFYVIGTTVMKALKTKIIAMAFSSSELLKRVRETGFSLTLYCKITLSNHSKMLESCLLGHFH